MVFPPSLPLPPPPQKRGKGGRRGEKRVGGGRGNVFQQV